MIVQSGKCLDRFEFLTIFSAFALKCGWSINKQSKTELYLKNSYGNYLQIMLDYVNANGANVGLFAGALSFDESKGFEDQPGYSRLNQHSAYKSSAQITTAIFFNYKNRVDYDMEGYTLVGDSKTLFCNMELRPNATYSFFSSNLTKFHEFNGGHIIFSDCFAGYGPYGSYSRMSKDAKCIINQNFTPFELPQYEDNNSLFNVLVGGYWHTNQSDSKNSSIYNLITKSRIMTNLQEWENFLSNLNRQSKTNAYYINNKDYIKLNALSVYEIAKVIKDKNTGLNVVVAPEFFYKNDLEKWTHAGILDDVRIVGFTGLKNRSELHMGSEKFMVFEPHGDLYSANKEVGYRRNRFGLAVRL
ncbi:hypothetical protein [Campylobacter corcagiensis]|uniref:Uncharacterized protein n=1 Tax=Campylobacter corcagiensis TaxID=1448857 RepID=A0A7M1LG32_9BACT|nr:hypothetical protein [Campylobacter corcagiensis]QKF64552.1 hypothetical protein CCORG_0691 [Campylobacter corcagiensis]QOQ87273.1 hypothetical protein IMC76_08715 [Campylobacter corcagiensis]